MPSDLVLIGKRTLQKEAGALAALVDSLDESFDTACRTLFDCKGTVLVTGMGKSGLVARKWASTFAGTGTRAYFINAGDASHGDLGLLRPQDVLVALSFSGETEELGSILRHADSIGVRSLAVTGNPRSSLARRATSVLEISLAEEACPLNLAPTTSTTLMMALGDALAVTLMQMRGFTEKDFARLHPGGSLGRRLWLGVRDLMHKGEELPVVAPGDALERVLVEMTRKCLGMAIVVEQGRILGVITDGDLRRGFQGGKLGEGTRAEELMTANPRRLPSDALAVEARELMEKHSIHQLLIVDGEGSLAGVIHLHDLLRAKVL